MGRRDPPLETRRQAQIVLSNREHPRPRRRQLPPVRSMPARLSRLRRMGAPQSGNLRRDERCAAAADEWRLTFTLACRETSEGESEDRSRCRPDGVAGGRCGSGAAVWAVGREERRGSFEWRARCCFASSD